MQYYVCNINRESTCRLSRSPFSLLSLELGAQLYRHQFMASSIVRPDPVTATPPNCVPTIFLSAQIVIASADTLTTNRYWWLQSKPTRPPDSSTIEDIAVSSSVLAWTRWASSICGSGLPNLRPWLQARQLPLPSKLLTCTAAGGEGHGVEGHRRLEKRQLLSLVSSVVTKELLYKGKIHKPKSSVIINQMISS
jgi:hypothetical protein